MRQSIVTTMPRVMLLFGAKLVEVTPFMMSIV